MIFWCGLIISFMLSTLVCLVIVPFLINRIQIAIHKFF